MDRFALANERETINPLCAKKEGRGNKAHSSFLMNVPS